MLLKFKSSIWLCVILSILAYSLPSFAASIIYTYDSLNRVTSVDYGNGFAENYTYDSAGNRLSLEVSSKKVSGSGYNYPEAGFQASLSLDVRASSLGTGWLNYYYSKLRINLESTLITGLSIVGDTITITGEGTVNGVAGYTFTVTIIDGNPDTMEIIIYNPDGTVYFTSGPGALSSGDFNVVIEYQLTTSVSPSGSGTVTPDCSAGCQYDDVTLATLSANENSGYSFSDWAGCDSLANNICTMTMDADKSVTANFQSCPQPVRIAGTTPAYYSSLQAAYDAAVDWDTIQTQALSFTEDLNINIDKSVTLEGGYDCNYLTVIGNTTLNGNMTISDGTITTGNFVLGN